MCIRLSHTTPPITPQNTNQALVSSRVYYTYSSLPSNTYTANTRGSTNRVFPVQLHHSPPYHSPSCNFHSIKIKKNPPFSRLQSSSLLPGPHPTGLILLPVSRKPHHGRGDNPNHHNVACEGPPPRISFCFSYEHSLRR